MTLILQLKNALKLEICLASFFRDYGKVSEENKITLGHQVIIPTYKFVCDQMCGNITEWGVDVHRGGRHHQEVYTLDLQVWRPSPTVNHSTGTGCYSLVGNNRFTSISLQSQGTVEQAVTVTPSSQDYIPFRPGDVLGFYVNQNMTVETDDGVVVLTSPSRFSSELVWYASIVPSMTTSRLGDCPYSVGRNGVLDTTIRAAPVISVRVGKY